LILLMMVFLNSKTQLYLQLLFLLDNNAPFVILLAIHDVHQPLVKS